MERKDLNRSRKTLLIKIQGKNQGNIDDPQTSNKFVLF